MAGASPIAPIWSRRGLVLKPGLAGAGWSDHCQMPTPYRADAKTLRLFYCSRDSNNRAHVFHADIEPCPPWRVLAHSNGPVLAPGPLGSFDAAGVMPTSVVERDGVLWMYYIGWSVRADVPYHNAIGIAQSHDGGRSFARLLPGPVVGTAAREPYFCGTADVARVGDGWRMWYMSATEWRVIGDRTEPRYHLKQASSLDGITWDHGRDVAVDYLSETEGGIARATVMSGADGYWMWFCHRGLTGYHGQGPGAYRLGVAHSPDGSDWRRLPGARIFDSEPDSGDFDADMQCYPAVFETADAVWMFYNGSDFGQTGIGISKLASSGARP